MIALSPKYGIAALVLAGMLGGCTTNSDRYPSLAIRDYERVVGTFEVAEDKDALGPPAPASEAAIQEAAQLLENARLQHQSFIDLVPEVKRRMSAAEGLGPGDDEWAQSQLAFAELDTKRGQLAVLLGSLDLMFVDASQSYQELEEIEIARDEVHEMVAQEDSTLEELATLGQ